MTIVNLRDPRHWLKKLGIPTNPIYKNGKDYEILKCY